MIPWPTKFGNCIGNQTTNSEEHLAILEKKNILTSHSVNKENQVANCAYRSILMKDNHRADSEHYFRSHWLDGGNSGKRNQRLRNPTLQLKAIHNNLELWRRFRQIWHFWMDFGLKQIQYSRFSRISGKCPMYDNLPRIYSWYTNGDAYRRYRNFQYLCQFGNRILQARQIF